MVLVADAAEAEHIVQGDSPLSPLVFVAQVEPDPRRARGIEDRSQDEGIDRGGRAGADEQIGQFLRRAQRGAMRADDAEDIGARQRQVQGPEAPMESPPIARVPAPGRVR